MADLPTRANLTQLRIQAKDLLKLAHRGDASASSRMGGFIDEVNLSAAQLTIAREYGFTSWPQLKKEVERRGLLDNGDIAGLAGMVAREPELAVATMERWCDHPLGAAPLNYVAMLRYDTTRGRWRNLSGTGPMAQTLIDAGAPVDGRPGDPEPPLITAASYGDAAVAKVLLDNGADLDAVAGPHSGAIPDGTALSHAAVFGMTEVVDVLVAAGAGPRSIEEAAAAGDITGWLTPDTPLNKRIRALVMAADHQRLEVIDQLIAAETPVDATDTVFGRHPLRTAAGNGRPNSVRRLLDHGADPNLRDPAHGRTPLDWCRLNRIEAADPSGFHKVEEILKPLTIR